MVRYGLSVCINPHFDSFANAVVSPYVMTHPQNYSEWPPSNLVDWTHRTLSMAEGRCQGERHRQRVSSAHLDLQPETFFKFE